MTNLHTRLENELCYVYLHGQEGVNMRVTVAGKVNVLKDGIAEDLQGLLPMKFHLTTGDTVLLRQRKEGYNQAIDDMAAAIAQYTTGGKK